MNTDQAFSMLKEAGVTDDIETFRTWLHEGKIKAIGFKVDEKALKQFIHEQTSPNKDDIIRQLKAIIKAKNEHIKGMEELHENAINILVKQRDQLNKEIVIEKNKQSKLRRETIELLKENIELREELIALKEILSNGTDHDQFYFNTRAHTTDYRQKLGLSKKASQKEVLAGYKELLKISHPDRGGNAKLFQYIKTDYDLFKDDLK